MSDRRLWLQVPAERKLAEQRALATLDSVAELEMLAWSPEAAQSIEEIKRHVLALYGAAVLTRGVL